MDAFLVGGAVRDALLNYPTSERDWVVVGATDGEMGELGFKKVVSGFPVYIHPETGEEYALARREIKTAPGYRGFRVEFGPEVTLEQDLLRRDLTINALAEDITTGEIIDLFHGRRDLTEGLLRHISPSFVEDPVRLLRAARFAARLGRWGFRISHGTHELMKHMASSGELEALQIERLWLEMKQALAEDQPWRFFEVMHRCGALSILIPELVPVMGCSTAHTNQPSSTMISALKRAAIQTPDSVVRFAVAMYDAALLTAKPGALAYRLRVEREYADLLERVIQGAPLYQSLDATNPEAILRLIDQGRATHQPGRFHAFLAACQALWPVHGDRFTTKLMRAVAAVKSISGTPLIKQGLSGKALKLSLTGQRLAAIERIFE